MIVKGRELVFYDKRGIRKAYENTDFAPGTNRQIRFHPVRPAQCESPYAPRQRNRCSLAARTRIDGKRKEMHAPYV
jgi:hypothetical protein